MKVGFLITARLKSTRLPKKLLKEIDGVSMMSLMIRRLKLSNELSTIVIATSTNHEDDPLEIIARQEGIECFRGSEEDVIQRLYAAAVHYGLDYVINMTADCPMVPFDYIGKVIDYYKETDADLVSCYELPAGLFLSGLKIDGMKKLLDLKDTDNTEYWLYYYLKTDLFKVLPLPIDKALIRKDQRIVLDYPEDFEMLEKLYHGLGKDAYKVSTKEVIEFLDQHPEFVAINKDCSVKGQIRTDEDPNSKVKLK